MDEEDSPGLQNEKLWEQLDNLEQRFLKSDNEEEELEPAKSTYKKPDKNWKIKKIKTYQEALEKHRRTNNDYHSPEDPTELKMDKEATLKMLRDCLENEKNMPMVMRAMGLKRVKILFRSGAIEHVNTMIKYLETGQMPTWIGARYKELVRRRKCLKNPPSQTS